VSLILLAPTGMTAEQGPAAEFKVLEAKVKAKLGEGKRTEQDLAPELKEFDALLAKYKDQKTDEVAEILLMEANLYLQVFDNTEKGAELIIQLQRDFPNTTQGRDAFQLLEAVKRQEAAKRLEATLVPGAKFPAFNEKDVNGKPFALTNYLGKVVLLDFWATWSGACMSELPNYLKLYETYHAKGFEIIGVSLEDDPKRLANVMQEKKITWPQYFDGQGWQGNLVVKYHVYRLPTTYLLDGEGKIIGRNLRGKDLEQAVAKALAKP
jgi:peroxiredoxin